MTVLSDKDITMRDLQEMGIAIPHEEPEIELLDALEWLNAESNPYAKRINEYLNMLFDDNQRLLAGYPNGLTPTDVDVIKEANGFLAEQVNELKRQVNKESLCQTEL